MGNVGNQSLINCSPKSKILSTKFNPIISISIKHSAKSTFKNLSHSVRRSEIFDKIAIDRQNPLEVDIKLKYGPPIFVVLLRHIIY